MKTLSTLIALGFCILNVNITLGQQQNALIQIGGPGQDQVQALLPNSDGTITVSGTFADSIYVNSNTSNELKTTYPDDIFLYKMASDGSVIWQKAFGCPGNDNIPSVLAKDNGANIYMGGVFSSDFTYDGQNFKGNQLVNAFIVKFNSQGKALWSKYFPSNGLSGISSLLCDGNGNLYALGGSYGDSITIGGKSYYDSTISFIVKYDSLGNLLWSKIVSGHYSSFSTMAMGANGTLYLGGLALLGQEYYGNQKINKADTTQGNIFARINTSDGSLIWAEVAYSHTIPNPNGGGVNQLITAPSGNVFASGFYSDNMALQGKGMVAIGANNPPSGILNMYIMEFDTNGKVLMLNGSGIGGSNHTLYMTMDNFNHIYLTGDYQDSFPVGKGSLLATGESDVFIVKFDSLGNYIASQSTKGVSPALSQEIVTGIYLNPNGDITIGGSFNYETDFGNVLLTHSGLDNGYIWTIHGGDLGIGNPEPFMGNSALSLYPNPVAGGEIMLKSTFSILFVQFYDNSGKLVYQSPYEQNLLGQYPVSGLSPGLYTARIVTANGTCCTKFIKE